MGDGSYLVDISEVPDFNTMYELYDPVTVMFFFRCVLPIHRADREHLPAGSGISDALLFRPNHGTLARCTRAQEQAHYDRSGNG
jgi:hypothetical protein